jgi:hypothetical protein
MVTNIAVVLTSAGCCVCVKVVDVPTRVASPYAIMANKNTSAKTAVESLCVMNTKSKKTGALSASKWGGVPVGYVNTAEKSGEVAACAERGDESKASVAQQRNNKIIKYKMDRKIYIYNNKFKCTYAVCQQNAGAPQWYV